MHSLLNLPVQNQRFAKFESLAPAPRGVMKAHYINVCAFIVDEISMVSQQTLLHLHLRMQEIFDEKKLFGGIPMLVFGDMLQLEPVKSLPCYVPLKPEQVARITGGMAMSLPLWDAFVPCQLSNNHRSAGDSNKVWRDILTNVALGMLSREDIQKLNERLIDTVDCISNEQRLMKFVNVFLEYLDGGHQPLCLFPKRTMCKEFNDAVMVRRQEKPVVLPAVDAYVCPKNRKSQVLKKVNLMDEDERETAGNSSLHLALQITNSS